MNTYSKIVLTIIAGALVTLCIQNAVAVSKASSECGYASFVPCYVEILRMPRQY
jgi:hypothetical protein